MTTGSGELDSFIDGIHEGLILFILRRYITVRSIFLTYCLGIVQNQLKNMGSNLLAFALIK